MYYYRGIVAYDGTDYEGWQIQPNGRAVANRLASVFNTVFGHMPVIIGASRTDAGVHAQGQVIRIATPLNIDPHALEHAWNNRLPSSIMVRDLVACDESFHPQKDVAYKTYWYHVSDTRPLPFAGRYVYRYRYAIDQQRLQESLNIFVGEHDFRSFCTGDDRENTVRVIHAIRVEFAQQWQAYRIVVEGPGFLRYMIRRIVGAALEVSSREGSSLAILKEVLEQKDPEHSLPNAPAHGLMLAEILYTKDMVHEYKV
jgi:tRNA pseudouridine38-40 synthase